MAVIESTDGEARVFQGIVTGIGFYNNSYPQICKHRFQIKALDSNIMHGYG